jgi:oxalate decarboxylase
VKHPHLFHLESNEATRYTGGSIRKGNEVSFPIVRGNRGSIFSLRLEPNGIREPHWHPAAWEFDYCIAGTARMSVVSPDNQLDQFVVHPGDAVFVPQGFFHYFENVGEDELHFVIVFNSSDETDVGITTSLNGVPDAALAAVFGVPESVVAAIPRQPREVIITRRPSPQPGVHQ